MTAPWIAVAYVDKHQGGNHIAISWSAREAVDAFAAHGRDEGHLDAEPPETGDGFHRAIVRFPDGTRIDVTA